VRDDWRDSVAHHFQEQYIATWEPSVDELLRAIADYADVHEAAMRSKGR
jgi:hypothetical protein